MTCTFVNLNSRVAIAGRIAEYHRLSQYRDELTIPGDSASPKPRQKLPSGSGKPHEHRAIRRAIKRGRVLATAAPLKATGKENGR